jgi:hypothetical protein
MISYYNDGLVIYVLIIYTYTLDFLSKSIYILCSTKIRAMGGNAPFAPPQIRSCFHVSKLVSYFYRNVLTSCFCNPTVTDQRQVITFTGLFVSGRLTRIQLDESKYERLIVREKCVENEFEADGTGRTRSVRQKQTRTKVFRARVIVKTNLE